MPNDIYRDGQYLQKNDSWHEEDSPYKDGARETLKDCGYEIVDSFVSTPLFSTLPRNALQWIAAAPRMALSLLSKSAAATLLGGHSLVVLAKS